MSAPDREKVINQLEADVRRAERTGEMLVYVGRKTAKDALVLLKEQEPVMPVDEQCSTVCGVCGHDVIWPRKIEGSITIDYYLNFCPFCGRAVKWE